MRTLWTLKAHRMCSSFKLKKQIKDKQSDAIKNEWRNFCKINVWRTSRCPQLFLERVAMIFNVESEENLMTREEKDEEEMGWQG